MNGEQRNHTIDRRGFGLIESIIGAALFAMIALSVSQLLIRVVELGRIARQRTTATALANEQFEIIRNLPYSDVGIVAGLPVGKISATQTLVRDGLTFTVKAVVRNIDDPFDGTIGGTPNDLSPADYRLVQFEITCAACTKFKPMDFTTTAAPKNLESASTNGALFIQALDANGQPIAGANVHVENNAAAPIIAIDDTTNANGILQLVDVPPGVETYEITVTKSGYSTDRTYTTGLAGNPDPSKPHATVVVQQLTQISFAIDRLSTVAISSVTSTCTAVPSINGSIVGSKLIGNPDVLKYVANAFVTDGAGNFTLPNMEWDAYQVTVSDAAYDLIGSIPPLPIALSPNTTQQLQLVVAPKDPSVLVINVKDGATSLPLSGASVRLEGPSSYDETLTSGRGFLVQTDWSGGPGQDALTDATKFFETDGNIAIDAPTGELRLSQVSGSYVASGTLTSSTFDAGSPTNFYQLSWQPSDQPVPVGTDPVRFQIATNTDNSTWNFLGPDGTAATYYTLSDTNISSVHTDDRYLRYKLYLQTADTSVTPNISDIAVSFTSACVPPGQVAFRGLTNGSYTLTVSKSGYQIVTQAVTVIPWLQQDITLTPQ